MREHGRVEEELHESLLYREEADQGRVDPYLLPHMTDIHKYEC